MSTQTLTEKAGAAPTAEPVFTEAEVAAIDALMADMKMDKEQASGLVREAMDEMNAEPLQTIATNEAEQYLARLTRRLFVIKAERTRVEDQMKAMLRSLDAKASTVLFVMRPQAEIYTKQLLAGQKAKSRKFPYGTVGYRATQGSIEFLTEKGAELLEWCKQHCPAAIYTPPQEIRKTPLTELCKVMDAKIPGTKFIPPGDKWYVS